MIDEIVIAGRVDITEKSEPVLPTKHLLEKMTEHDWNNSEETEPIDLGAKSSRRNAQHDVCTLRDGSRESSKMPLGQCLRDLASKRVDLRSAVHSGQPFSGVLPEPLAQARHAAAGRTVHASSYRVFTFGDNVIAVDEFRPNGDLSGEAVATRWSANCRFPERFSGSGVHFQPGRRQLAWNFHVY